MFIRIIIISAVISSVPPHLICSPKTDVCDDPIQSHSSALLIRPSQIFARQKDAN